MEALSRSPMKRHRWGQEMWQESKLTGLEGVRASLKLCQVQSNSSRKQRKASSFKLQEFRLAQKEATDGDIILQTASAQHRIHAHSEAQGQDRKQKRVLFFLFLRGGGILYLLDLIGLDDRVSLGDGNAGSSFVVEGAMMLVRVTVGGTVNISTTALKTREANTFKAGLATRRARGSILGD